MSDFYLNAKWTDFLAKSESHDPKMTQSPRVKAASGQEQKSSLSPAIKSLHLRSKF